MLKKFVFLLVTLLLLGGCTSNKHTDEPLRISATTWIGYVPLYYAKEKGWLKDINIELSTVVSLSENMSLYKTGNFDAYVGTQYEYHMMSLEDKTLLPVILFDRSYGGDIVMADRGIKDLQETTTAIDVYLEMDSINKYLFDDFVQKYELQDKKFTFLNNDQAFISSLNKKSMKNPTIIVTYNPYNIELAKKGFIELATTKESLDLFVFDALFTKSDVLMKNKERFTKLKKMMDDAIDVANNDPKEFYNTVKGYLEATTYEDFKASLNDIIWINKNLAKDVELRIQKTNIPTRGIIR